MVQTLKEYLRETLNEMILHMEDGITKTREKLRTLEATNMERADYLVKLHSLSEDKGEDSITIRHRGTLKDAIERAEKEFKSKNGSGDVEATYFVEIFIGKEGHIIPEEYLFQFMERHSSG